MKKVGVDKNVILVVYDWGFVLGFDWVRRNLGLVKVVVYMEGIFILFYFKVC